MGSGLRLLVLGLAFLTSLPLWADESAGHFFSIVKEFDEHGAPAATPSDPLPQVVSVQLGVNEIRSWKDGLVYNLSNDFVREKLASADGKAFISDLAAEIKSRAKENTWEILLVKVQEFVKGETGEEMKFGLLDTIDIPSLRRNKDLKGRFAVEYKVSKDEMRKALKEILYAAGYIEGIAELLNAFRKPEKETDLSAKDVIKKRLVSRGIERFVRDLKAASINPANASEFLENHIGSIIDAVMVSMENKISGANKKPVAGSIAVSDGTVPHVRPEAPRAHSIQ